MGTKRAVNRVRLRIGVAHRSRIPLGTLLCVAGFGTDAGPSPPGPGRRRQEHQSLVHQGTKLLTSTFPSELRVGRKMILLVSRILGTRQRKQLRASLF